MNGSVEVDNGFNGDASIADIVVLITCRAPSIRIFASLFQVDGS